MGRQIGIYQTQKDVEELCKEFYPKEVIIYDKQGNKIEDYSTVSAIKRSHVFDIYYIAYRSTSFDKSDSLLDSQLIEYAKCRKPFAEKPYYNDGRFYLYNALYDNEELVKLYNSLVRYIKKNYKYCAGYYFAPDFIKAYQNGEAIPCNFNHSLFEFKFGAELERVLKGVKFN